MAPTNAVPKGRRLTHLIANAELPQIGQFFKHRQQLQVIPTLYNRTVASLCEGAWRC